MLKTGFRAFIYSFSVSLFAIVVANRAFLHKKNVNPTPLDISNKNIVLFLKNTGPAKSPSKKIALNILPDIPVNTEPAEEQNTEVILASAPEEFDFPLEIADDLAVELPVEKSITINEPYDIVYGPSTPLKEIPIEAEPIYQPEKTVAASITPPPPIMISDKTSTTPVENIDSDQESSGNSTLAENEPQLLIPLQQGIGDISNKKIVMGNADELNHVALNNNDIPIRSMEKAEADEDKKSEESEWHHLSDNPWVVAKSSGGKNLFAAKEFAGAANEDIGDTLNPMPDKNGVQLASETVKNIMIPVPNEIMEKENLTPKLAYPSGSDDDLKEKAIDEAIKKQTALKEKEPLLTPIDDGFDFSLDEIKAPEVTPIEKPDTQDDKKGIMGAINSLFNKGKSSALSAKEKALAKANARRKIEARARGSRPVSIMPTEIRLSFQANKAEISGQTLRWVQAFAAKAAKTPNMILEIRIDGTNTTKLQQRRLNLLYNILTNKGVEYSKINTVFTVREPNSFILRTIKLKNEKTGENKKKNNDEQPQGYIQW